MQGLGSRGVCVEVVVYLLYIAVDVQHFQPVRISTRLMHKLPEPSSVSTLQQHPKAKTFEVNASASIQ